MAGETGLHERLVDAALELLKDHPAESLSLRPRARRGGEALARRRLDAALELLKDHPAESLSLRHVALQVGVSHQAPYVHFGDKRRFLAAAAGAGMEVAAHEAASAVEAAGSDPRSRLHALVDAY